MALSDIVNVSISTESAKVERAGFGVPLILAADAPGGFTERVRYYTSITGLALDFATTTATYKMASAVFAQNPRVPRIAVGRLALKPTLSWTITPVAGNTTAYTVYVNGTAATYTSDSSGTVAEITAGLKTAIDALAVSGLTTTDNTTSLTVALSTAGAFASLEVANPALLGIVQAHSDPGVATDLAAIAIEDSTWYAILNPFNSKAMAVAIAAWAETAKKLFICQSQDSTTLTVAVGSDTGGSASTAAAMRTAGYYRTAVIYHPETSAFADGAWAGACLPLDPGSETWAFKTLAGVDYTTMTATHRTNALAKNANIHERTAGVSHTYNGTVAGGEYVDVIRGRDWLEAVMSEDIFEALANARKIPFTDAGISVIEGIIKAKLTAGVASGLLAADPAPAVTVPKAADVSSGDKALRKLTGVKFDATLAGAIHATTISGVVSV